jgi:type I restriction enzyme S subunit
MSLVANQALPEGYKQTEIGIIPNDWNNMPLRSALKESPKYGINAAAVSLQGDLPVYIRITDITEDGYFKPTEKVGVNNPFSNLYKLNSGDIVLARTGASVGKSYLYREKDGELVYAGFLIKVSPNTEMLNPEFLFHYLKTEQYWAWVIVNSMRSGQPGINGNEYGSLLIPLPHIEEQTAIANALSDVDALLTELEKLIAKKQAIKIASMQQLLTGKTRLPQFATYTEGAIEGKRKGQPKDKKTSELGEIPEDWDVVCINDISSLIGDGIHSTPTYDSHGNYYFVNGNNIQRGALKFTENTNKVSENEFKKHKKHINERTLFLSINGTIGNLAYYKNEPIILGKSAAFINIKISTCLEYAYHIFSYAQTQQRFEDGLTGSTIKNLGLGTIKNTLIPLPSKDEQTAIATILSDMDNEIQTLEQRLTKTRQIKQGMMQQLLTGRTRLPY